MAEAEQRHRHKIQRREILLTGSGQWLGTATILILFALAAWLEINDRTAGALAVFVPALTAFITAIVTMRKEQKKQAKESNRPEGR